MNRAEKIEELYLNSLLKISEQDETVAQVLLESEGIDNDLMVGKTMKNIKNYEYALTEKIAAQKQEQLMETLIFKISMLMEKVPQRITTLLNAFVQPHIPAFRFKSASYTSDLTDVFGSIDPLKLLEELESIEQEIN